MKSIRMSGAILLCVLSASSAWAVEPALKAETEARFKEGVALMKLGKYEEARMKFSQAYALVPNEAILLNLAITEQNTARPVESLAHLRQYLASANAKPDKVEDLRKTMLVELEKQTGHLQLHAVEGRAIKLDDSPVGVSPLATVIDVAPGAHAITDGTSRVDVTVAAGETKAVNLEAKLAPPPTPTAVAPAPMTSGSAPPVASNPPAIPPQGEEGRSNTRWIVGGSIAGVGVAGIVIGAGFAASSSSTKNDVDSLRANLGRGACPGSPQCASLQNKIDTLSTQNTVGYVGYIGGAVLVAAGVSAMLLWPKEKRHEAWVVPFVDRSGAGAAFGGTF